jgi:hypothetical protein
MSGFDKTSVLFRESPPKIYARFEANSPTLVAFLDCHATPIIAQTFTATLLPNPNDKSSTNVENVFLIIRNGAVDDDKCAGAPPHITCTNVCRNIVSSTPDHHTKLCSENFPVCAFSHGSQSFLFRDFRFIKKKFLEKRIECIKKK